MASPQHEIVPRARPGVAPEPRRTADILIDVLAEHGVDTVFGIPGGAIGPMYDALLDRSAIRVITTKHEGTAVFAACGYARTSGKIGVVFVTSGPGFLNSMTGLASAFCDGLPVLVVAGEVSRKVMGRGALQEGSAYHLDVVGIARRVSKTAVQLQEPNAAPAMLRRAIATMLSGRRGPATITIPVDVSATEIVEPTVSASVATSFSLDPAAVFRTVEALATARHPLIFAGAGIRGGDGPRRLREAAERLQIPVMTTPKGKGVFPESHPLSLGVFGIGGHPSATSYVRGGVDAMLAIGTSLGELSTNGWSDLVHPEHELIHVDVDANQVGKCYPATLGIVAPAEPFLEALREQAPAPTRFHEFGVQRFEDPSREQPGTRQVTPQRALWEIQRALPPDTIYASDVGEHSVFATHYLHTDEPDGFILMNGLGSMGQSFGSAMGAQLARRDRSVAVICGDGGFAMTCGDIATAAAERLPIVFFIFNDARLGMVEIGQKSIFGRTHEFTNELDIPSIAAGLGAQPAVVNHPGDILDIDFAALRRFGPIVVDVRIDRDARMPKHGRFEALGNQQKRRTS